MKQLPRTSLIWQIALSLTTASLIAYVYVLIANTELFAASKQQGADASWTQHTISGLIFLLPSLSATVLLLRRQKPGAINRARDDRLDIGRYELDRDARLEAVLKIGLWDSRSAPSMIQGSHVDRRKPWA